MKNMLVFDTNDTKEKMRLSGGNKTVIIIQDETTGEVLFKGSNKVVLAGSEFTALRHFNFGSAMSPITKTYNGELQLDNTVADPAPNLTDHRVFLFAVGTDGCGPESSQVYNVKYNSWIKPEALVPFRYVPITADIDISLRDMYFGRKTGAEMISYYFKKFESDVVFRRQYVDGTPITAEVYEALKQDEVESYTELKLKVTQNDCRDFFINTTGINDARINTLSLLTAWPKEVNGLTYYQEIRPFTKLNFPNEWLIDTTKGLNITYQVYY